MSPFSAVIDPATNIGVRLDGGGPMSLGTGSLFGPSTGPQERSEPVVGLPPSAGSGEPILIQRGDYETQLIQLQEAYDRMDQIPYYSPIGWGAPNSKSFLHQLLSNAGINTQRPPGAAGWGGHVFYGGIPIDAGNGMIVYYDENGNLKDYKVNMSSIPK